MHRREQTRASVSAGTSTSLLRPTILGLRKPTGLFPKVLEHIGISPGDVAYIGDDEQRDMQAAMTEEYSQFILQRQSMSL
jgi:histidinol phosphatase-like enzyme